MTTRLTLYSISNISKKSGVPLQTLINWIKAGRIPAPDCEVVNPDGSVLVSGWTDVTEVMRIVDNRERKRPARQPEVLFQNPEQTEGSPF